MNIVSININKLKTIASKVQIKSLDNLFTDIEICRKKIIEELKPVFGNIMSYKSAAELYAAESLFSPIMTTKFMFYDNRMFLVISFDEQFIFEVDTDRNNYPDLEPSRFNYMHLGDKHKYTGINKYKDYSLGYICNKCRYDCEQSKTNLPYLTFVLFKNNIIYTVGSFHNGYIINDFKSDKLEKNIDSKELLNLMNSIIILNEINE
jgi:hypothetical protein